MSVNQNQVTVGTTPTLLSVAPDQNNTYGSGIIIQNNSATDIRVGGPTVTATTGGLVPAGSAFADDVGPDDVYYGIVASGTATVDVVQRGV